MTECRWCGETHAKGVCPKIKAIEFFENGEVRRVEFLTPADYHPWPALASAIPAALLPVGAPLHYRPTTSPYPISTTHANMAANDPSIIPYN